MLSSRKTKRYLYGSLDAHEATHVLLARIGTGIQQNQPAPAHSPQEKMMKRKNKQEETDDTPKQIFGMK